MCKSHYGSGYGMKALHQNHYSSLYCTVVFWACYTGKQRITAMQMPSVACHLEMTSTSTGKKVVKTWTWCAPLKFSVFKSNLWMPTSSLKSQKDPVVSTVIHYVQGGHQRTLRPTTKSASSESCRTHSVPATDASSMDLELWFHRACSPRSWIFCISDTSAWNEWSSWQEPLSTGPVLMSLLRWLADDVTRVANTRTSHLSLQFTHGCYQKSLGAACTWIMQSTSWVKIGWWSRMLTQSIHTFIQRHPHPLELL